MPRDTSSHGESAQSAALADNKAIGRRILVDVWGEGKLAVIDELVSPDYVDRAPRGPEPSRVKGPEGLKEAVLSFRAAFPDLTYHVDFQLAEGDLVATRFTATGTQTGLFQGIPPTGRRIRYSGIDINRIANGMIVEAWVSYDALGLLEQLGARDGESEVKTRSACQADGAGR